MTLHSDGRRCLSNTGIHDFFVSLSSYVVQITHVIAIASSTSSVIKPIHDVLGSIDFIITILQCSTSKSE